MSRKRVAVFGNAWSYEFVQSIMTGVMKYSKEFDVDVDTFITYTSVNSKEDEILGESNIFRLPDLKKYDGAIVLANTLNTRMETELLGERILEAGISSVCLESHIDGINFIGSENYEGMYELAEHVFGHHGVKDVLYISGPKDNFEAQERLKAVADAAKKNNVPFGKENIYYGDWSYYSGVAMMEERPLEKPLPKAIMCANDTMAIGICEFLQAHNYSIPDEVIVTGFDALEVATNYYPSISTVGRNWDSMGYDAMEFVLNQNSEDFRLKRRILKSKMILGESCGCTVDPDISEKRLRSARLNGSQHAGNVSFDVHMRNMYTNMNEILTVEELNERVSKYYLTVREAFEGSNYYVCVDKNFFSSAEKPRTKKIGFGKEMLACVSICDGVAHLVSPIGKEDILPEYARKSKAKVLNFKSLYSKGRMIGYVAMEASLLQYEKYSLYVWARHMYQNFDQIERNNKMKRLTDKLTLLSNTDSLTGIYNRMGCDNLAVPFFHKCIESGKNVGIIMCDVDDMKLINDGYGHLQGDLALRTLANSIKLSVDDKWYPCRYGGDEFIIIGECENDKVLNEVIDNINNNIINQVKETHLQYELEVSVGGVIIDSDDDVAFETAVKIADDRMYKVKSTHKSSTGGKIR